MPQGAYLGMDDKTPTFQILHEQRHHPITTQYLSEDEGPTGNKQLGTPRCEKS